MKTPHDKYILTLIAGKMTNPQILQDLKVTNLPVPAAKDIDLTRKRIFIGKSMYKQNKTEVDLGWLDSLGIEAMFGYKFGKQVVSNTTHLEGAFKVLNDPGMFKVITSLAMGSVTEDDIELLVNTKYDIEYSSEELDAFLYYFFNLQG